MTFKTTPDDLDFAEALAKQAPEWMLKCPLTRKCPCGDLFRAIIAQQQKIERLEYEIKRLEEFPGER